VNNKTNKNKNETKNGPIFEDFTPSE